jgi:hypothetical protein
MTRRHYSRLTQLAKKVDPEINNSPEISSLLIIIQRRNPAVNGHLNPIRLLLARKQIAQGLGVAAISCNGLGVAAISYNR